MFDYEFTMPYPPSVGRMWRAYRGRFILSKVGRDYRQSAIRSLREQGIADEGVGDRLSLTMTIDPPTLRKYDIDNRCKAPFDALTHAKFWLDDEQVDKLTVIKGRKIKDGLLTIKINRLSDEQQIQE